MAMGEVMCLRSSRVGAPKMSVIISSCVCVCVCACVLHSYNKLHLCRVNLLVDYQINQKVFNTPQQSHVL